MKINDVIVEAPMGILKRAGQNIMSKIPGGTGAKAQGKLDTGRVANNWKKQYMQYLGRSNQPASTESLTAFLKTLGLTDQTISSTISEFVMIERPLTRVEVDKFMLSAAQNAAISGSGVNAATSATSTASTTADTSSITPTSTAAPAAKPGLFKRAASAVGRAVKGVAGAAPASAASSTSAPSSAASSTSATPQSTTKSTGASIDTYINNWAKSINTAATPQEKITLAKEVINFLKDRKGSPEGQRGAAMAKSVLKRSNDPTLQKMAQSGAFAMERKIYAIANKLLEAVGLTWKDLGYRILVTESTSKYVVIGIR